MLEWVFSEVSDDEGIKAVASILNFYNALKAVGLRLDQASPGEFYTDENGGFVILNLPSGLAVSLMVMQESPAHVSLVLAPQNDGMPSLDIECNDGRWQMRCFGEGMPNPVIVQLAHRYGVEVDGDPVSLDATQLARFCRELTLLAGAAPSTLPPTSN